MDERRHCLFSRKGGAFCRRSSPGNLALHEENVRPVPSLHDIGKATAAGGGNYFLPETVKDVEGGVKYSGRLGEMPVRANVAVYSEWIRNVQRTAYVLINGNIASFTANVPRAKVTGFEGDVQARPTEWLTLGGSFAHNRGRFTSANSVLFGQAVTFGPYGDTPHWTGSVYGELSAPLPNDLGTATFRTDVYHQTSFWYSNLGATLTPGTVIPGYTLVNMRLDVADIAHSGVTASLFVRNLTNKLYYMGGLPGGQNLSVNPAVFGMPRMYGVVLRYNF